MKWMVIILLSWLILKPDIVSAKESSVNFDVSSIVAYQDSIAINVSIFKGDTNKRTLNFYVVDFSEKKISNITKISISKKNTSLQKELILHLNDPCGLDVQKEFFIIAEGLDIIAKKKITLIDVTQECANIKNMQIGTPDFQSLDDPKIASEIKNIIELKKLSQIVGLNINGQHKALYKSSSAKSVDFLFYFIVFSLFCTICAILMRRMLYTA